MSATTLPSSLAIAFPSISLLSPSTLWRAWSTRNRMELAFGSTASLVRAGRGTKRSKRAGTGSMWPSLEHERAEAEGQGGKGEVAESERGLAHGGLVRRAFLPRRGDPQRRLGDHGRGRGGHAHLVQGDAVEALGNLAGRRRSEDRQGAGDHEGADGCPRQGLMGALVFAGRRAADELVVVIELADDGGCEVDAKQPDAERLVPDEHPAPQRQRAVLGRYRLLRGGQGRSVEVEVRVIRARLIGRRERELERRSLLRRRLLRRSPFCRSLFGCSPFWRSPFGRSPGGPRQQQHRDDKQDQP